MSHAPLRVCLVVAAFLFALPVQAQFANRGLGLTVGYLDLPDATLLNNALPTIGLEGKLYIDNGFEWAINFPMMVVTERVQQTQLFALSPSTGFRYLLLEEGFRPYVGLDVSFLWVPAINSVVSASVAGVYFGPAARVGFDVFVAESVSLGLSAHYSLFLALNTPPQSGAGVHFVAAAYY